MIVSSSSSGGPEAFTIRIDVVMHLDSISSTLATSTLTNPTVTIPSPLSIRHPASRSTVLKVTINADTNASQLIDFLLEQHFETAILPKALEPYFRILIERQDGHYYLLKLDDVISQVIASDDSVIFHCKLWKSGISRFDLSPTTLRSSSMSPCATASSQSPIKDGREKENLASDINNNNSIFRRRIPPPRVVPFNDRPVSVLTDFSLEGWMHKEGFRVRSWKRRYFVLDPIKREIHYFKDSEKQHLIGTWNLSLAQPSDLKIPCDLGRKLPAPFCWSLKVVERGSSASGGGGKERVLCCEDESQFHSWIERVFLCL